MREILFLILITFSTVASGTNYYISNSGNDSNDGKSPSTAWNTLHKVNSQKLEPGDSVLFERGSIWIKETLAILYSGTAAKRITYSAYGDENDPLPRFTGIHEVTGTWTNRGNNVWSISVSITSRGRLWINGEEKPRSRSDYNVVPKTLNPSYPWQLKGGILYVYSIGNPATNNSKVEITSETRFMTPNPTLVNYITLSNLDIGGYHGNRVYGSSDWIVENCKLGWGNFEYNLDVYGHNGVLSSNWVVRHNNIDSGDRFPESVNETGNPSKYNTHQGLRPRSGSSNWQIHHNNFLAWTHAGMEVYVTSASEGIKVYNNYFSHQWGNYGRAFNAFGVNINHFNENNPTEFYNNYIYKQAGRSQIGQPYLKVYNNIFDGHSDNSEGRANTTATSHLLIGTFSNIRPYKMQVYNNVFAKSNKWGVEFEPNPGNSNSVVDCEIVNNIFYQNSGENIHGRFETYKIETVTIKNNLFYGNPTAAWIWYDGAQRKHDVSQLNAVTAGSHNPKNWVALGNIDDDPMFVDPLNGNYKLQAGSPAIGAGLTPLSGKDMAGNDWADKPGIGPYIIAENANPEPVQYYTLSLENEGDGIVLSDGEEESSVTVESDTTITMEAIPDQGWTFSKWAGDVSGSENPLEIKMNEDKNIKAIFIEETYTLTIIYEGEGDVIISPEQESYVSGTMINIEALAEEYWQFDEWEGDLKSADIQTSFVIEQNMSIKATFNSLITNSNLIKEGERKIQIYPNPARGFFSISVEESTVKPDGFNIIDLSGRIVYQGMLMSNTSNIQIPNFLNSGIYVIELISKKIPFYTQRLVITK